MHMYKSHTSNPIILYNSICIVNTAFENKVVSTGQSKDSNNNTNSKNKTITTQYKYIKQGTWPIVFKFVSSITGRSNNTIENGL